MVFHGLSTILYCRRRWKEMEGWEWKSKVKSNSLLAMPLSTESKEGICVQHGMVLQCGHLSTQLIYYPFVSPKPATITEWQQLSFLPFPARVTPVKYRWNELGCLCDSLSNLALQNPCILLSRSVTCKAHCNTHKAAQGKPMVNYCTPCTGSNICLSTHTACKQHLARQDIWLNQKHLKCK